jgi:hypothetical protein
VPFLGHVPVGVHGARRIASFQIVSVKAILLPVTLVSKNPQTIWEAVPISSSSRHTNRDSARFALSFK